MAYKKRKRVDPLKLLITIALELVVVLGLLIVCTKVFPDNPILAPLQAFINPGVHTTAYDVVLDAGHGGYDHGTVYEEYSEKDITLKMTKEIGKELEDKGYRVLYTRENDDVTWSANEVEDLSSRVKLSNESNANLFVSIHLNSAEVSTRTYGFEIWGKASDPEVYDAGNILLKHLDTLGYTQNRGFKDQDSSPIQVLHDNKLPSLLIEAGFLRDEHDRAYLVNEDQRVLFSKKIADGIDEILKSKES